MANSYATELYAGTNPTVWYQWLDTRVTTSATATTVWYDWNSATLTSNTWHMWLDSSGVTDFDRETLQHQDLSVLEQRVAAASQIASRTRTNEEREAERGEYEKRLTAERAARELAERKAEDLLLQNLSLRQRLEYQKDGHFVVHGRSGHRYRVRRGRMGNIDVVGKDGRQLHALCAHPELAVPNADTMLAQKLMLEVDEASFIRIANKIHTSPELILPTLQ